MAKKLISRNAKRKKRHRRLRFRNSIWGTAEKPRMSVFRSLRYLYVQLIDDDKGHTILSSSTLNKEIREQLKEGVSPKSVEAAQILGEFIGKKAKEHKIEKIVFDVSGYKYHGRVKALADGARKAGLKF